ncbi:MAG TPA: hypothetical protein VLC48_01280 [Gemmatimonadota bacterium]|nr:hypothetical protein [Gemmatimonadota bacterium]
MRLLIWGTAIAVALVVLDRLLLWMESSGWIYYRRNKPAGGGSLYHMMQIHSIVDPAIKEVIEAKWHDEEQEDEAGDPPAPDGEDGGEPPLPPSEPGL